MDNNGLKGREPPTEVAWQGPAYNRQRRSTGPPQKSSPRLGAGLQLGVLKTPRKELRLTNIRDERPFLRDCLPIRGRRALRADESGEAICLSSAEVAAASVSRTDPQRDSWLDAAGF